MHGLNEMDLYTQHESLRNVLTQCHGNMLKNFDFHRTFEQCIAEIEGKLREQELAGIEFAKILLDALLILLQYFTFILIDSLIISFS